MAVLAPLSSLASAGVINVDSVTTVAGTGSTSSTVAPGGEKSVFFNTNTNYNINWLGQSAAINTITAGGTVYNVVAPADTVTIRKNTSNTKVADRDMIWYQGSVTGNNITLKGTRQNSLSDVMKSNDVLMGIDNMFSNRSGGNGDNTRAERLDVVFNAGIVASASKLFGVFERGKQAGNNSHDPFKIAAITKVDANGNPIEYSDTVIAVEKGWGTASILGSTISTIILRNSTNNSDLTSPAAIIPQPVGGVLIPTDDLAGAGVTIYGYSLFAYDVTGSGSALLDWNTFDKKTHHRDGGLDLIAFTSLIGSANVAIPEPASVGILALGLAGLLKRRRRTA